MAKAWKPYGIFVLLGAVVLASLAGVSIAASTKAPREAPKQAPMADKQSAKSMTLTQGMVLGIVEGLTEYLPVSSTGHLLVAEKLMGLGDNNSNPSPNGQDAKDAADAYAICIQAGAIVAVLFLYARRFRQMIAGIFGKDKDGLRIAVNVVTAFLPAAVIGLLFNKLIKTYLFGMWPVVAAWFVGGVVILAVSHRLSADGPKARAGKSLDQLRMKMALVIGFMQCIAMWPGVSRSLVTIVGGILVGLSVPAAVEFSFLLGLITLGAATGYDALKHGSLMLQTFDALSLAVGLIAAFVFAVLSIKWMVGYLQRHSLAVFGTYRVIVALVAASMILAGWI